MELKIVALIEYLTEVILILNSLIVSEIDDYV